LQAALVALGWTDLDEIPSAIELEAIKSRRKVIFEAKTVTPRSELSQTRSGLSQLLEYRFFNGEPSDCLCLVTDAPISDRRIRLLESNAVAVAYEERNGLCSLRHPRAGFARLNEALRLRWDQPWMPRSHRVYFARSAAWDARILRT
jgi:hypothetical protein